MDKESLVKDIKSIYNKADIDIFDVKFNITEDNGEIFIIFDNKTTIHNRFYLNVKFSFIYCPSENFIRSSFYCNNFEFLDLKENKKIHSCFKRTIQSSF